MVATVYATLPLSILLHQQLAAPACWRIPRANHSAVRSCRHTRKYTEAPVLGGIAEEDIFDFKKTSVPTSRIKYPRHDVEDILHSLVLTEAFLWI